MKARVFYLVDSLRIGGSEGQAVEAGIRLHRTGLYEVTFGCLNKTGPLIEKLQSEGMELFEFPLGGSVFSRAAFSQMLRLRGLLRKSGYQVIHCHDQWSNILGVLAGKLAGTPLIFTSQRDFGSFTSAAGGWTASSWKHRGLRRLQRASSKLIVNAQAIKDAVVKEGLVREGHIVVIRNGVERNDSAGEPLDTPLPVSLNGRQILIHVANMNREIKGHGLLVEAAASICKQTPDCIIFFVGDGELRSAFEDRVKKAGLEQNIFFLGKRTDVSRLLKQCHIGLLTSVSEGLPNSVLEYMSAGLAVVATNVGGVPELIEDGRNGLLVPSGNASALAQAVTKLMQDPELARRMGTAARRRAQTDFSFERLVTDLQTLYSRAQTPTGNSGTAA